MPVNRLLAVLLGTLVLAGAAVTGKAAAAEPPAAGSPQETKAQRDQRMAWWRGARFGMFIHWGSSGGSVLAGFSAQGKVLKAVPVPLLCWRVRLGRNPDHPQARPTCVTNGQDQRRGTGISLEMTGCVRFPRMNLKRVGAEGPLRMPPAPCVATLLLREPRRSISPLVARGINLPATRGSVSPRPRQRVTE